MGCTTRNASMTEERGPAASSSAADVAEVRPVSVEAHNVRGGDAGDLVQQDGDLGPAEQDEECGLVVSSRNLLSGPGGALLGVESNERLAANVCNNDGRSCESNLKHGQGSSVQAVHADLRFIRGRLAWTYSSTFEHRGTLQAAQAGAYLY